MNTDSRQVEAIRDRLARNDAELLTHPYFLLCEYGALDRQELLEVIKQLYCFSVFFERILTRRLTQYSTDRDARIAEISRSHLREEIGHAAMFRQCLLENGVSVEELDGIVPKMFTKAMFGYLLATVEHENEYVTNIAIMQVMEGIGYHFFAVTLRLMRTHGMLSQVFVEHSEADEDHRHLGLDLAASFDEQTMSASLRIIDDIYRLMDFMLTEFVAEVPFVSPRAASETHVRVSRITSLRPDAGDASSLEELDLRPKAAEG